MVVTPLPNVILKSPVVPSNADTPILVTVAGTETSVIEVATRKAFGPIEVTPLGMITEPTQLVLPVTTLRKIVKVPLVPQLMLPSATAFAVPGIAAQSSIPIIAVMQYFFMLVRIQSGELS
jgi:hypothetical protein